jgi:AcrR family transcriptional regulator
MSSRGQEVERVGSRKPVRRRRVEATLQDVIDAATEIADTSGLSALTIRAVASALDLSPMSVYRFVDSKDDLINKVAIRLMDRAEAPQAFDETWQLRVVALMRVWRNLFLAHPSLVEILADRRTSAGSEGLARLMEGVLANLNEAGLDDSAAVRTFWQVFTFTFGQVVFERPRYGQRDEDDARAAVELKQISDQRGFERVSRLATELAGYGGQPTFEDALLGVLRGIQASQGLGSSSGPSARR